jgi:cyanate lyase
MTDSAAYVARPSGPFVIGHLFRRLPDHSVRVLVAQTSLCCPEQPTTATTKPMCPSPSDVIALIREAKEKKSLTWEQIAARVERSPVYITSVCLGENSLSAEDATKLGALLDLGPDIVSLLQSCPKKGSNSQDIPKDPLLYRFHEINLVYGETLKELIHEKFGDGIMSAIDFTMEVEKVEDPKGDRVKVTMCGKFLPYKKW